MPTLYMARAQISVAGVGRRRRAQASVTGVGRRRQSLADAGAGIRCPQQKR